MENQVCISLQLQEDQPAKSFTTQVVSLTSWDLFILVYMQEQNFKTSYKNMINSFWNRFLLYL